MMTKDHIQPEAEALEAKLLERFGAETHFTAPEGYFDSLTDRVMSRIAEHKTRRHFPWRWAVAAMLTGFIIAGGVLIEKQNAAQTAAAEDIQYIEDALDYSMIDNMSIASYLTEAE